MNTILMELSPVFQSLYEQMPELVDRKTASRLSGGMVAPGSIANADSVGDGPAVRVRTGRKVAYPRLEFVKWLAARCTVEYAGQ